MLEPVRCPSCGAAARAGQPWCTQCWVDLREPTASTPVPAVPGPRTQGDPGGTPPGRGWPCGSCGELNELALDRCAACGTPFLTAGEGRPTLVVPLLGDLLARGRTQRLLLATAVAGALALLLVLLVLVVGAAVQAVGGA